MYMAACIRADCVTVWSMVILFIEAFLRFLGRGNLWPSCWISHGFYCRGFEGGQLKELVSVCLSVKCPWLSLLCVYLSSVDHSIFIACLEHRAHKVISVLNWLCTYIFPLGFLGEYILETMFSFPLCIFYCYADEITVKSTIQCSHMSSVATSLLISLKRYYCKVNISMQLPGFLA